MRRHRLAEDVVLTWIAVLAVGLGSYAFRLTPLLLGARLQVPGRLQGILRHAGMGGIAALLVSSVLSFGTSGGLAGIGSAGAATAVAAVVAWRGRSIAVVVLAGGAVYAVGALAAVILG
jgi:branched-subunit amino acid transport protein